MRRFLRLLYRKFIYRLSQIKFLRLFYLKMIYNVYKFCLKFSIKFLEYKINRKLILYSKNFYKLLMIIYTELDYDYFIFKINLSRYISYYKKLGFFKHILFIFFFFAGLIPLLILICIYFFFFKYLLKYICVIIEFFFFPNQNDYDEKHYYFIIKSYLYTFFELIPLLLQKIYQFLFKSRWTLYFYKKFKNYLKKKRTQIFNYFINKIDYFLFNYVPRKKLIIESYDYYGTYAKIMVFYYRTKRQTFKILRIIRWRVKNYIYWWYIKNIYNVFYIRIYINIIRRNYYIYILRNYYLIRIFFLDTQQKCSDFYYRLFYIYKHIQYYSIWLYKTFLRSYACIMTIEAFFLIFYKNCRGYIIHFLPFIYYSILYVIISNMYKLVKLHFERREHLNYFIYYLRGLKIKYKDEISNKIMYYYYIFFHNIIMLYYVFIARADLLIDLNEAYWYVDFSDKSLTWWQIVLDDVVQRFFVRAHWSTYYSYKFRFFSYVYNCRLGWIWESFSERIISEIIYFYLRQCWLVRKRIIWFQVELPYKIKKYFTDKRYYAKIFYYIKFKGRILYQWKVFRDWLRDLIHWLRNLRLSDIIQWYHDFIQWLRGRIHWLRNLQRSDLIRWSWNLLFWLRDLFYWYSELIY